ncbi:DUF6122 family protein [Maribacter flavus]|uniref:Metal-dependent hydrolase n=1 Tax=Maribacter flavus TaxID=1658664 RepID=A0A5B2TNI9_9FLAO|nr:DUF6122 family protein [Maribacter flavus]KAA2215545.1 hypothetical protein F0361_18090 [Maribacter flavus]
MLRFLVHYGIHFIVPILVALFFFKEHRLKVALILLAGIVLDVDHLLASPIFDADRCSINFHPLHTYWAIAMYCLMLFWKTTRIWGIAFLIHMVADLADCLFIRNNL